MNKVFLVWYDTELKEILSIEKENSTPALEGQLKKLGIEVLEFEADNFKEANKKYVENFETLKPHAQFVQNAVLQDKQKEGSDKNFDDKNSDDKSFDKSNSGESTAQAMSKSPGDKNSPHANLTHSQLLGRDRLSDKLSIDSTPSESTIDSILEEKLLYQQPKSNYKFH